MTPPIVIPYSRQLIEDDDIQAVVDALKGDWLTQGPLLKKFEEKLAQFCGARYAVAFSNGTAALHGACVAGEIKQGDQGLVPAISFAATANCLEFVGAAPLFCEVTQGLPLLDLKKLKTTPQTKVIIPVHFAGACVPMEEVKKEADKNGWVVIEDACHALGSSYQDGAGQWHPVGACSHSHMAVFSLHAVKNITTGEGGFVTTNDPLLFEKLLHFRQHGIIHTQDPQKPWHYEMRTLGYNYRMTEIQGALGLSQLKKLSSFIERKTKIFQRYVKELEGMEGIKLLQPPANCRSALHLCVIEVEKASQRDPLFNHLRSKGIGCQLHYIPIYRHPYYAQRGHHHPENFPVAEDYYSRALSLPLYPQLSQAQQDLVIEEMRKKI